MANDNNELFEEFFSTSKPLRNAEDAANAIAYSVERHDGVSDVRMDAPYYSSTRTLFVTLDEGTHIRITIDEFTPEQ